MTRYLKVVMMRKVIGFVLALMPIPTMADTAADALRELVLVGDVAAVEATVAAAVAEDAASTTEPDLHRILFTVFSETHPDIGAFTARWLRERPNSALAMTAQGGQDYALGWAIRGESSLRETYSGATAAMIERHREAFVLMTKAVEAAPDLVAASDGILRLTRTLDKIEVIPVELERIMARRPNRGSLTRAMEAVAPRWGGNEAQVDMLCERYAPKIVTIADYTIDVCMIDALYVAAYWDRGRREDAHKLLQFTTHPILDYARLMDAVDGFGSPEMRVKLFEGLKAKRTLNPLEASALDIARNQLLEGPTLPEPVDYMAALPDLVKDYRLLADRDPYNVRPVHFYLSVLSDNAQYNAGPYDAKEVRQRLQTLLTGAPYDGESWRGLVGIVARLSGNDRLGPIEEVEPYHTNALHYTNYSHESLSWAVRAKVNVVLNQKNVVEAADISDLSPEELARLDRVVHCPLLAQTRILQVVCADLEIPRETCGTDFLFSDQVQNRLAEVVARGARVPEATLEVQDLLKKPVKMEF